MDSLWRSGGLLDDADEGEAGAAVDVVLLVGQNEGLGGHHLQVDLPGLDALLRVHLGGKAIEIYCACPASAIRPRMNLKSLNSS